MCGRSYSDYIEQDLADRYSRVNLQRIDFELKPNFNTAPTHVMPIILNRGQETKAELYRWGLIPSWAKDVKSASQYSLINARGEEILEKPSFKEPFRKRRCIVPMSGFFEWHRTEKTKQPFLIRLKGQKIMSVAGIYEHWQSRDGKEKVNSFSIITCASNATMQSIHNRMPVILDAKDEWNWLNPDNQDTATLKQLLKPCPDEWLETYEVSTLVNSPSNNSPEVLAPLKV